MTMAERFAGWEAKFTNLDLGCCGGEYCDSGHDAKIKSFIQSELDSQRDSIIRELEGLRANKEMTQYFPESEKTWVKALNAAISRVRGMG